MPDLVAGSSASRPHLHQIAEFMQLWQGFNDFLSNVRSIYFVTQFDLVDKSIDLIAGLCYSFSESRRHSYIFPRCLILRPIDDLSVFHLRTSVYHGRDEMNVGPRRGVLNSPNRIAENQILGGILIGVSGLGDHDPNSRIIGDFETVFSVQ